MGVTAGFCALLERTHQNGLAKLAAPPIKRLPFVSTSSVPQTGELGNKDWIHPCGPAVGGAAELPAAPIVASRCSKLDTGTRDLCRWSYLW